MSEGANPLKMLATRRIATMAYYGLKTFTFRSYGLHSGSTQKPPDMARLLYRVRSAQGNKWGGTKNGFHF